MGNLFKFIGEILASGFLRRLLAGAGIQLVSSTIVLTVINYLLDRFIADFFAVGNLAGLVGVSGLDKCVSIIFSAFIARAIISSSSLSLTKN
ncbi:DUF2523 family protein [Acinetobacter baumannii]|uniref:DUF2523 domain-containing protein n=1 Tax=Acinetobacter baumannii (strain 1295743) TaxID=1310613 RepID=A0A009IS15_ACIB9|nr:MULTISPECIES: DUF2523 family protein [Acinetobacter calcoaceticus/baumannii complex]EXB06633.1 hypothetical protein J512_1220 [Acinetobacter baumannii 1295743]MCA4230824.1 DUF2523 domain-containing protein [Acinetobacter baumannii]MCT9182999.1 DUF2523 domain-containing protein [Acinetobacter baumannii]MCT9223518.1 DUF2523 domain-containing protein [Acinetobacter baumannii]MCT9273984.1 DUF2523 domain-containing protein [Acinetobacter baumannii]